MAKVTMWKRGDVVRLKSGGPKMTINSMPDKPETCSMYGVMCKWFDGEGVPYEAVFDSEALRRASR